MTILEATDRVANAKARAEALMLALDGIDLGDNANAIIFLAGEVHDYIRKLSDDLEASPKA